MTAGSMALGLAIGVTTTIATTAADQPIDNVTFRAERFACELRVDGEPKGRLEPGTPRSFRLPRKVEYLVECESHELPLKLYARYYLARQGSGAPGNPLRPDVSLLPVAVLPNAVRAASAPGMAVTAVADTRSVSCTLDKDESFGLRTGQVVSAGSVPRSIARGALVRLTSSQPISCGGTNLVEVSGPGWTAWFPNRAFQFSYRGRPIGLFETSQNEPCCWIE